MSTRTVTENFDMLGGLFSQFACSEWRTFDKEDLSYEYVAGCLTDMISDMNADQNIGLDWNTVDDEGKTLAFYMLKEYPQPIMVDALRHLNVNLRHTTHAGDTLLHEVCACHEVIRGKMGHHAKITHLCIKKLCEHLDINARNNFGETPIFMVQYTKDIPILFAYSAFRAAIDAMIECGADIFIQDNNGRYFTDFCKTTHSPIARCLDNERIAIERHMLNTVAQAHAVHNTTKGRKI